MQVDAKPPKEAAAEAFHDWKVALAEHGIELNVPKPGTTLILAVLDSDDVTTRAAVPLNQETFQTIPCLK